MSDLVSWVGRPYQEGECWKFVRDANRDIRRVELPESYYDASCNAFGTVHNCRETAAAHGHKRGSHDVCLLYGESFTPQRWDVVTVRTHPILILHCGVVIDAERFIHPWDGFAVISRFDDPQMAKRIAGFLRPKSCASEC
jgi:hypothetical protein